MSSRITEPFLILCEGKADKVFLKYLLEIRGIEHSFEFFEKVDKYGSGNTAFEAYLKGLPVERGFENVKAILIVTDCDEVPQSSFEAIQTQIENAGFGVPSKPLEIIKTPKKPAIAVVMIPFDNICGNLESYIVRAMSDKWIDVKTSADRHINDTPASVWEDCKKAKSIMQCMIAVLNKEDPNKSLAYIWSENEDFQEMLKADFFNELSNYLRDFPSLLERE